MRLPWPAAVGGSIVLAIGAAGLIRGAVPQSIASTGSTGSAPIVVANAYVRPPVPPTQLAAAYFTVYNTTAQDDQLVAISTGAGADAVLHKLVGGVMSAVSGPVTIPAHGSLVLSAGTGHVMISNLFGPLKAGQSVDIELTFANAGQVTVSAPVIPYSQPAPGAGSGAASGAPAATSSSGATK
jgi:periplasmic copper chaperone A